MIIVNQIRSNPLLEDEDRPQKYDFVAAKVPNYEKQRSSLFSKITYIIASILTIGILPLVHLGVSKIVPLLVLPALTFDENQKKFANFLKTDFLKINQDRSQPFTIKTHDGAEIDGMNVFKDTLAKQEFKEKKAEGQKWVVCLNGNAVMYEHTLGEAKFYKKFNDANILFFNYRGVGKSTGFPEKPEDLYTDAEACVEYLLSSGVKEEDIVIVGHSLGGGIGAQIAVRHEKINYINERSFSSLSKAGEEIGSQIWRPLGWVAKTAITSCNWEMDTLAAWDNIKGKKLIVLHKKDKILGYHQAGLYKALKEKIKKENPADVYVQEFKGKMKKRLIEVKKPPQVKLLYPFPEDSYDAHNYSFLVDPNVKAVNEFIAGCFKKD